MFRKPAARKFRKRTERDDEDADDTAQKPVTKKAPKSSMLSFDEEQADDGAEFIIKKKKKKTHHRHSTTKSTAPAPVAQHNTQMSAAGAYSAENIKALSMNATYTSAAPQLHDPGQFDDLPRLKMTHSTPAIASGSQPVSVAPTDEDGHDTEIPDEEMIRFVKEKRERLRTGTQQVTGHGYIPLQSEESRGDERESRLVREDADDTDEHFADADGARLGFGDPVEAERKVKKAEMLGALGMRDNDETFEWEMEQIRKGTGGVGEKENSSVSKMRADYGQKAQRAGWEGVESSLKQVTVETLQQEIREALLAMQDKHEADNAELERLVTRHQNAHEEVGSATGGNEDASRRYQLFQHMQEYVLDLLDCFEAKLVDIEECEDTVRDMRKTRYQERQQLQQAYRTDLQSEYRQFVGLPFLGEQETQTEREQGRLARAQARAMSRAARGLSDPEGMSSDEEDEGVMAACVEQARNKLEEAFEEVTEEMKSLEAIKASFTQWKQQESASYRAGFVAESMPSLFGPLVRKSLLSWMPLVEPDLTRMAWFGVLQDYGMIEGQIEANDQDYNLIPKLVANTALPIACDAAEFDWDPTSRSSCKKMERLWQELTDFLDTGDREMSELLGIIQDRLLTAVQEVELPSQVTPAASEVLQRLFWRTLKMLRIVTMFKGVLPMNVIHKLAFKDLIETRFVPHLQQELNTGATKAVAVKCIQIVDCLPQSWSGLSSELSGFVGLSNRVTGLLPSGEVESQRLATAVQRLCNQQR